MRCLVSVPLFLLCEAIAVAGQGSIAPKPVPPLITQVNAQDLNGLIAGLKGNVILVNFWATWCAPCVQEFPDLVRLRTSYHKRGLELIFVSIDHPQKSLPQVSAFLRGKKVDFPTYIKQAGNDETFINSINSAWSGAVPATFIYDRHGKLAYSRIDAQTYEELEGLVTPLLGK